MSRRTRDLGIVDMGPVDPAAGSVVVKRGIMNPEQKAGYIAREAARRGLTDEQREQWVAAGGHTAWLYMPEWTGEDEDDDGAASPVVHSFTDGDYDTR
jgi:hypothetical protein